MEKYPSYLKSNPFLNWMLMTFDRGDDCKWHPDNLSDPICLDFLRIANCTCPKIYCRGIISFENSLGGDPIEGGSLITYLGVEVGPELDKEESVLRALAVEHLQSVVLFRELVLDLPHVHRLRGRERG